MLSTIGTSIYLSSLLPTLIIAFHHKLKKMLSFTPIHWYSWLINICLLSFAVCVCARAHGYFLKNFGFYYFFGLVGNVPLSCETWRLSWLSCSPSSLIIYQSYIISSMLSPHSPCHILNHLLHTVCPCVLSVSLIVCFTKDPSEEAELNGNYKRVIDCFPVTSRSTVQCSVCYWSMKPEVKTWRKGEHLSQSIPQFSALQATNHKPALSHLTGNCDQ